MREHHPIARDKRRRGLVAARFQAEDEGHGVGCATGAAVIPVLRWGGLGASESVVQRFKPA
jgi:hypothetical protein